MAKAKQVRATAATDTPEARAAAEVRAGKFKKSAGVRVMRALKALDAVAQLGNKRRYGYSTEQAQKIVSALDGKMDLITAAFGDAPTAKQTFEV